MKKTFAVLLTLALSCAALAACGGEPADTTESAAVTTTQPPTTQPPPTESSGAELIGKWGHVILDDNGFATRFLDLEFTAGKKAKFSFGYNGSGYGGKGSGTYALDGFYIHLDLTAEIGDEVEMNEIRMPGVVAYELKDGDLVLYPAEGNEMKTHWFYYLDAPRGLVLTKNRSIHDYD